MSSEPACEHQCSLDLINIFFGIYLCVWSLLLSDKQDSGARYTGCFLSNKQNGAFTWGACTAGLGVNMQTADRAFSLPDFVTDGPHLIFRELNKNEADKKRKLKKKIK